MARAVHGSRGLLEAGGEALARAAWAEARERFEAALAEGESVDAFLGLGIAARAQFHPDATLGAHERGYRLAGAALRRYLRRRRPLVSSALARAEVTRAFLPLGEQAVRRGQEVLARLELIRVSDRILADAGSLLPAELRTLDAIHLATARQLGSDLARLVTYDEHLRVAADATSLGVAAPR